MNLFSKMFMYLYLFSGISSHNLASVEVRGEGKGCVFSVIEILFCQIMSQVGCEKLDVGL